MKRLYMTTLTITLLALGLMVLINFISFYSNAVSDMYAIGESSLSQEKEQLNGYLLKGMDVLQVTAISIEHMMKEGASSEEIEDFLMEESERYMKDIDSNFTGVYGVFNGDYIDGIGWVPEEDYVPQEREWYVAAKEAQGSPVIVSPYLDAQTNTIMISVSQMLYDGESVISIDIALEEIQVITQNIQLNGMGYGFVIDKKGLVVAHSDESEKGKNYTDDEETNKLLDMIYANPKGISRINIEGENCIMFSDVIMKDWFVTMIISDTKLFHDIRLLLIRNIIICVVVFVLITILCTHMFKKVNWYIGQLKESNDKIEQLNDTVVRTLARTIDAKDRYTNGHSQRVAKYSVELARRMGKSEEEIKEIYYAGMLHDVGKIHIPDAIINKPAKLTDEEFEFIKLHPVSGYHILKDMKETPKISQGAKWHHERYDGKGYPNGLSGDAIPEAARIIGVADAYDAMTSNRSYRKLMPQDKVRSEIEKGIGSQFDPDIARIMLEIIDEDKDYDFHQKSDYMKNILIVDDDSTTNDMVDEFLKQEPQYKLYKAKSGKEAMKVLDEINIDILLLDIYMPHMNGFEFLYFIKNKFADLPVIFLTSDRNMENIDKANEMGVDDYLIKPLMKQTLLEVVHSVLQEKADI